MRYVKDPIKQMEKVKNKKSKYKEEPSFVQELGSKLDEMLSVGDSRKNKVSLFNLFICMI